MVKFILFLLASLFCLRSEAAYFPTTIVNQGTSPWVTTATQAGAPWDFNLTKVGGSNVSLGQTTMANSIPIAIASDQLLATSNASIGLNGAAIPLSSTLVAGSSSGSLIPIKVDGTGNVGVFGAILAAQSGAWTVTNTNIGQTAVTVTGTGSALNGDAIAATDVSAYRDISLQIVVTGTNTTTFQGSNDNFTTVFSVLCQTVTTATTAPAATTSASILVHCPVKYKFFRARVTAFTSGSSTGTMLLSPLASPTDLGQRSVAQNGTVTVSGTVTANPIVQTFSTQLASAARTTSGNTASLSQVAPNNDTLFNLAVTAVSGTNPTLDLVFQESYDNGTTWTDEWHWERVTATGQYSTPILLTGTSRYRFVWTIGGTTPSFTFSITSYQGSTQSIMQRRFFDRTINLNSGSSTTTTYIVDGCKSHAFTVNQSACTTFPTLTLQLSEDGTNFATTGLSLATTANGTFITSDYETQSKFVRLITTVAGSTCTLGYVVMRCSAN